MKATSSSLPGFPPPRTPHLALNDSLSTINFEILRALRRFLLKTMPGAPASCRPGRRASGRPCSREPAGETHGGPAAGNGGSPESLELGCGRSSRRAAIAFTVILIVSSAASGAVAIVPSVEQLTAKSSVVLVGNVDTIDVRECAETGIETVLGIRPLQLLKGSVDGPLIEFVEAGGVLEDRAVIVDGAPRYELGRRYLIFAIRDTVGRYRTVDMAAGAYRFAGERAGETFSRDVSNLVDPSGRRTEEPPERADALIQRVLASSRGALHPLEGRSPSASGLSIGSAADGAAWNWTVVSSTEIDLTITAARPAGNESNPLDTENRIIEDDPNGVIPGAFNGSGVIAASYIAVSGTHTFNGLTWDSITGVDIVTQDGVTSANLTQSNFKTAIAHEMGHTLGIRNADRNATDTATCAAPLPCSIGAVMSTVLVDGIGGTIQAWDADAAGALYGTGSNPADYAAQLNGSARGARLNGGRREFYVVATGVPFRKKVTWISAGGGNWTDATKWDLGVPADGDDVVINSTSTFAVIVNSWPIVHNLDLGQSTGSQVLQIGSGYLEVASGVMTVGLHGSVDLSYGLEGSGLIDVAGAINWTGGPLRGPGTLRIRAGAHLNATGTAVLSLNRRLVNEGTVLRSGSGGELAINEPLTNSGTIDVQSGTLVFSSSATLDSASLLTGAGDVEFDMWNEVVTLNGTCALTGAMRFLNGTVTAAVPVIQQIHLDGGRLNVTSPLTVTGGFEWRSGTLGGTSTTTIPQGVTLTMSNASGRKFESTLVNGGTIAWSDVPTYGSSTLTLGTTAVFDNRGTLRISSCATCTLTVEGGTFLNSGTVDVQTGELELYTGAVTNSGIASVAAGSAFLLHDSTSTFTLTSSVTGAGNVTFSGGTASINSPWALAGTTAIDGAAVTSKAPSIAALKIIAGTLTVSSALTISNRLDWVAGTLTGAATTTIAPAAVAVFDNDWVLHRSLLTHKLVNKGTLTWIDSWELDLDAGATLENQGTVDMQNTGWIGHSSATGPGKVINSGTWLRTTTTGTASVNASFTNNGTVEVRSGGLELGDDFDAAAGVANNGTIVSLAGATLRLPPTIQQALTATIRIDGTLRPSSIWGKFTLSSGLLVGAGTVDGTLVNSAEIRPGNPVGTLTVTGDFEQTSLGKLTLELGGLDAALNDHLAVTGRATLGGRLQIVQLAGFMSFLGDEFPIVQHASHVGEFAFVNGNTLSGQKSLIPNYQTTQVVLQTVGTPPPTVDAIDPAFGSTLGNDPFTITGSNFQEGATVTFGATAATTVNAIDTSTLTGTTPAHAAGVVDIIVQNPDAQLVTATGAFTFIAPPPPPTITSVTPATGPTTGGSAITVKGTNFRSGATLTLGGRIPDAVTFVDAATITAKTLPHSAGAVDVTVTNPATEVTHPNGRSFTLAQGFIYQCMTLSPPVLVTPAAGAQDLGRSVTLIWNAGPGDLRYDVYFDTNASPARVIASNVAANVAAGTNAFVMSNLLGATTYYWKIVAKGDPDCPGGTVTSVVRSFSTEGTCTVPAAFELTSPTDGSIGVTSSIQLSWRAATGAALYDVYLGPSNPPSFFGTTSSATLGANNLIAGTKYYWSVVAHASCDPSRTTSSAVQSFTIQGSCVAPGSFTLTTPADGAVSVATTPALGWTASANASAYDVYLGAATPPPLLLTNFTKQSISIAGLDPGGKYYWKIVAKAGCDPTKTSASPVVSFTTGTSCTSPGVVGFTFLPPGSVGRGQTYALAWSRSAGLDTAGTYVVERSTDGGFAAILDSQVTAATSTTFIADAEGTYYHRVRAVQGCNPANKSAYSVAAPVTVVKGRPSVIFTVQPEAVVTSLGDDLSTKTARFVLENLAADPVTVILGRQEINSQPFFTVTDPAGSSGFLTLDPRTPKELEIHFSGPPTSTAASYQGIIFLASTGAQLTITPYAFVNLKVGGQTSTAPQFIVDDAIAEYVAFPAWGGDDATRPPRAIAIRNRGATPIELGAEIGPEVWLVPEAGWNATPIPAGAIRTVNLYTQRNRAPSGSALPRYTYFTVRTRDGLTTRLLVQDNDASAVGTGRAAALDAGARSIIVPDVIAENAPNGTPLATQIRITNLGTDAVQADVYYTPTGTDGFAATVKRATIVVPPNDVVTLTDPLVQLFGVSKPARGQVEIRASEERIGSLQVQAGIVSTRGDRLLVARSEVLARGTGARGGAPQRVSGVMKSATAKTALILAETTGMDAATVLARLYDATGAVKGTKSYTLARYGHVREPDIVAALGGGTALAGGQVEISVSGGAGMAAAIAETLDANGISRATATGTTLDGSVGAQLTIGSDGRSILATVATTFVVPIVVSGQVDPASGSGYHVGMTFAAGLTPATGVVTFRTLGGTSHQQNLTLNANQTASFEDVLTGLFGLTGSLRGSVTASFDSPVAVSSRIYGVSTVASVPVLSSTDLTTSTSSTTPMFADGLEQSTSSSRGVRWDLYVRESAGVSGSVTVRVYESGNRSFPIEQRTFSVSANGQLKLETLVADMGLDSDLRRKDRTDILCVVTPGGGGSRFTAVALGIDNATGDVQVRPLKAGTGLTSSVTTAVVGKFPQISSFSPTSGSVGTTVTVNGTALEGTTGVIFNTKAATTFEIVSDSKVTAAVPSGATSGPITVVTLSGVTSSASSFSVQGTTPSPAITSFTPAAGAVGTIVTVTGSAFTGATAVKFNTTVATYSVASDTQITATVPASATTGKITVTTAGGTATSANDFTVTPKPVITSFTPTSGGVGTSVTITGSALTGATAVTFNTTVATYSVASDTQITATVPSGATTGKISVTTAAGTGTSANDFTVIPAPAISGFTPATGTPGTSVTINGAAFTGTTSVEFSNTTATFTFVSDTQLTANVPAGAASGKISVTTPGGTAQSASSFTVLVAPTISSFSPTSGAVGTSVTISGTGLSSTTSVKFNNTPATFTVVGDAELTATVPSGATTGKISVTTAGGSATSSGSFTVTVAQTAPTISSFTPNKGALGTSVTITGTNFTGTTAVKFNGTSATFNVVSATQITATVPAGATTGKITVTNAIGTATSTSSFVVIQPPTITGFTPTHATPGAAVTISGTAFTYATAVRFNAVTATFTMISDAQINATVPAMAKSGKITVTNAAGTATSATNFLVDGTAYITSFTPFHGMVGDTVTISGAGFTGPTSVKFKTTAATFTFVSDTKLTTRVPAGATTGKITVVSSKGTAVSDADFTVHGILAKGDANGDGVVGASDVFYLANALLGGGPESMANADVNGDGFVNITDLFYLINYVFLGGPGPV